jgi:hypothetical protein
MIAAHFNEIAREDSNWFKIEDTAQIEPADARDPHEIYRMSHDNVEFDAVFYPDRVEIQDTDFGVLVQEITNDRSKKAVKQLLDNAVHHLQRKL